ncbi:MAG TPA: acetate--CoA ligase family protein [Paraburkholderia sp.]|jgi:acetyltransferase
MASSLDHDTRLSEPNISDRLSTERARASPDTVSALFRPRSVAVIGASSNPTRFSGKIIPTLQRCGFSGAIYPVNAGRAEIAGLRCFPDLASVPGQVDCVVYAIAAEQILPMIDEMARKGVKLLVVSSAGFAERGDDEGVALQAGLVAACRLHGIRVLGPNCIGFANFAAGTCISSAAALEWPAAPAGGIGLVSQSGGLGLATILYCALAEGIGFSNIVTTGNEADLDTIDVARSFVDDPQTEVIAMTIEAVRDSDAFIDFLKLANAAGKPVVVLKSGRTDLGKTMAASHTGALAGSAAVFEAVCAQYGVTCATDVDDFYELAAMFAKLRAAGKLGRWHAPASGCAALSISGGHIGLFADHASLEQLAFPAFAPSTRAAIARELGFEGNFQNPLDTTARTIGDDGFWGRVTQVLLDDPGVQVVVPIITVAHSYDTAIDDFIRLAGDTDKIVVVLWAGGHFEGDGPQRLHRSNVPLFRTPARTAAAIAALDRYCRARARNGDGDAGAGNALAATPAELAAAREQLSQHARAGRSALTERESKAVLAALGVPTTRERAVATAAGAVAAAREIGYPVAVKGEHPAILHKSEAGIVQLGMNDDAAVERAFDTVIERMRAAVPDDPAGQVLVQEMVASGIELIAGVTTDPEFGPVVVFGLGGIFVEIMRDVVMRVPPFDHDEALRMLDELKGAAVLDGARGRPSVDRAALADLLVRLGQFALANRERVKEIDINPLIAGAGGSLRAVDGLIVLNNALAKENSHGS